MSGDIQVRKVTLRQRSLGKGCLTTGEGSVKIG